MIESGGGVDEADSALPLGIAAVSAPLQLRSLRTVHSSVKVQVKIIELPGSKRRRLVAGVVMIALGLLFLLDRLILFDASEVWRFWPLILVALGVRKMFRGHSARRRRWGVFQTFLGTWLLLDQLDIIGGGQSWPVLVMAVGALIIAASFQRQPQVTSE